MKSLVEALIFASSEPVSALQMKSMIEETSTPAEQRTLEVAQIEQIVAALNVDYAAADRPYRIIAVAGGYQFATQSVYAAWISRLYRDRMRRKLSQSALESLAIIAYKQPISKPEIEQIRGVNCDYVLKALLEKELVTITGRAETVGRPLLYGTTKEFLKHFGLNSITDLPRPREIEEILGENQFDTERRMLEAQEAAEAQRREAEDFESRLPHIPKRKPEIPDDVEIVPKKRVRQIRVRPQAEDGSAELPFGAPAEATQTPDSLEDSPMAVTMALPEVHDTRVQVRFRVFRVQRNGLVKVFLRLLEATGFQIGKAAVVVASFYAEQLFIAVFGDHVGPQFKAAGESVQPVPCQRGQQQAG